MSPRLALLILVLGTGCRQPLQDPDVLVIGVGSGRTTSILASARTMCPQGDQLMFNALMKLDANLRVVPDLAERIERRMPRPTSRS